jgi:hypothetical protein
LKNIQWARWFYFAAPRVRKVRQGGEGRQACHPQR